METKNAVIKSAVIEIEDHGLLTAFLDLDYGNSVQGFGAYNLYSPSRGLNAVNAAGHFIYRTLEVVGVRSWSELKGKSVRVIADTTHIDAIGHIIKDEWFYPVKEFEEVKQEKNNGEGAKGA